MRPRHGGAVGLQEASMRAMAAGVALAAVALAATMGTVIATTAEDDLAVVKRAVQQPGTRGDAPEAGTRADLPRTALSARDVRWFKVRITEKGAKKARVNVNLPIALVRALGDDFTIDLGRHSRGDRWRGGWRGDGSSRDRGEHRIRLGDVLATLEAGQSLVEIDDDDATVRVWVE